MSRFYIVRRTDRLIGEAQMALCDAVGFLRVVLKISLGEFVGMGVDDLNRILVGADGTVRTEPPELAADKAVFLRINALLLLQGKMGHIVRDADRKAVQRLFRKQVLIDRGDLGRRRILGGKTVAAADDGKVGASAQSRADILIERLAGASHLLGAVKHRDGFAACRDRLKETADIEGTVQVNLQETDLLPARVEIIHSLFDAAGNGPHCDDDAVRVRSSVIVENMVFPSGQLADAGHVAFHDIRKSRVIIVAGLADLEEDIRVLDGRADHRVLRIQGVGAESVQRVIVQKRAQILVIDLLHLVDLVGGAESVEEMKEWNEPLDRGQMRHARQVHNLLDVAARKQGKAGRTAVHNVRMVPENGQRVRAHRAACDMEHARKTFSGDPVHGWDHQHQTLGRGEAGRKGSGLKSAVDGGDGTGFRLHLHKVHGLAEQVLLPLRGPYVRLSRHGRGRRDRIDRRDFRESVGDVGCCLIAVYGHIVFHFFRHDLRPPDSYFTEI